MRRRLTALLAVCVVVGAASGAARAAQNGKAIFMQRCSGCHQPDAQGVPDTYPRLAGRVGDIAQTAKGKKYLVAVVSFGMIGPIKVDNQSINGLMPAHPDLSDGQIAAVLSYLAGLNHGGKSPAFTAALVHGVRKKPLTPGAVHAMRKRALAAGGDPAATAYGGGSSASGSSSSQASASGPTMVAAQRDWMLNCAGCHGFNGRSAAPSVPTVRNFAGYFVHSQAGRDYLVRVPGASMSLLSNQKLAAVLNWMLREFSPGQMPAHFRPYTAKEVAALRKHPLTSHTDQERARLIRQLKRSGVIPSAKLSQSARASGEKG